MKRALCAGLTIATVLAVAGTGEAHELTCEKTVDGTTVLEVSTYPATLHYEFTITNVHPTDASVVMSADDPALSGLGFAFDPAPPFSLEVGASASASFDVQVDSYQACLELAALDGSGKGAGEGEYQTAADTTFMNTFVVGWDLGSAECSAQVICKQPPPTECEHDCTPPESGGATRTMGFFKTHEDALSQCLAGGTIDLGFVSVSTLEAALGLLWGSPVLFGDGTMRSDLDKARFLLGRQTLVGICNQRLFGTDTDPASLLADAVAALGGTDCSDILALEQQVDAYNNSGDAQSFPDGFSPGPATPQDAAQRASDPTTASGMTCE